MNDEEKPGESALAMVCVSDSPGPPCYFSPAVRPVKTAIEARPLQSVAPRPQRENGGAGGEGDEERKREKEHRKRSKNWTRSETTRLIRIRSDMEPRFCRASRKSDLWDEISDVLRAEGIRRDAQQCRDKWEKLTAAYKEACEGLRDKEDYPFFSDLDPVLSGKHHRRENLTPPPTAPPPEILSDGEETEDAETPARRVRPRSSPEGSHTVEILKDLIESAMAEQRRFLADLMEEMDRREMFREKIRQEREERWREADREQRISFQSAIVELGKRIAGDRDQEILRERHKKRRSSNWKRNEVLALIRLRREMNGRFDKAAGAGRKGAAWEELATLVSSAEGVTRDGKQCREKWEKLVAEAKEVNEGKKDPKSSPYFEELLGRGVGSGTGDDDPTARVE